MHDKQNGCIVDTYQTNARRVAYNSEIKMQYSIVNNYVVARATTPEESVQLLSLSKSRVHGPHKKHKFKKECSVCHKSFKGLKMHVTMSGHVQPPF